MVPKLTASQVKQIRRLYYQTNISQTELGKMFKRSQTDISQILKNITYTDINYHPQKKRINAKKLNPKLAHQMRKDWESRKFKLSDLEKKYDVTNNIVHRVLNKTLWWPESLTY